MIHAQDFASEFPLAPDLLYLNHAAVAPWHRCSESKSNSHRTGADLPGFQSLAGLGRF